MNNINSLYQLIKKTSQQKGRPLKIICDWDDCLQPVKPMVVFRMNRHLIKDLKTFVSNYWESTVASPSISGSQVLVKVENYKGSAEEAKAVNKFEEFRKESRKNPKKHNFLPSGGDLYAESPYLSSSDELLQALKEDLIQELILISSYRKGKDTKFVNETAKIVVEQKTRKMTKSFMKFPQVKIEMTGHERFKPYRWEVLKNKYPDFDIFIDDNPQIIKRAKENLPSNKLYATCDYACNKFIVGDRVVPFHLEVSKLKDSDFAIAALEKKLERLEQEIKDEVSVKNQFILRNFLLISIALIFVFALLIWYFLKIKKETFFKIK